MTKTAKIIYWVATLWLSLGMVSSAIIQIIQHKKELEMLARLGYPAYLATLLGILKIPAVIIVLLPGLKLLKEWAYAGFFFCMLGALYSHLAVSDPFSELFGPILLLVLTGVSWYMRPENRKLI